ncbi:MAG TPA: ATP-binding protein [Myxococcota bacterium]|nr:ATP-binding protein [Myxococcota bacterium]
MSRTRKLQWVLYPSFLVVISVCLLFVGTSTVISVRAMFVRETTERLRGRVHLLSELLAEFIPGQMEMAERLVSAAGINLATRVTLILPDGKVVADSQEEPAAMQNHLDRPEIRDALALGEGTARRRSPTQGRDTIYHARSIVREGRPLAVVRVGLPEHEVDAALLDLAVKTMAGGLVAAVLAAFLSWLVSRRVARPVEEMAAEVKEMISEGSETRLKPPNIHEFSTLAGTMNMMADGLRERLVATGAQQRELETTLSGMSEAVLLMDAADRIRIINPAAERLLRLRHGSSTGLRIFDILRDGPIFEFVSRPMSQEEAIEEEISIEGDKPTYVHAFRSSIPDDQGSSRGTLLVLHDITRLKRLEAIRRDFVANVSHELKTPITSIKGFVETLRSDTDHDPETVRRFLDIIARHTDRLNSIIEDLLVLSRIEQAENLGRDKDGEDPGMARENVLVSSIVESVMMVCEPRASRKDIRILATVQPDAVAFVNQPLMEQALLNLVENAVKYTDQGGHVDVAASVVDGRLTLSVSDDGCGIPREHLPRIFERFYRVDKGRSRSQGGTGLGLSIVRHVATIHGGKVRVTSEPGVGSQFVIDVPAIQG